MAEAERSVAVRLRAVGVREFAADFGRAGKSVQDFATQAGRTSGSAAASTKQLGTAARQVATDVDKASAATKNFGDAAGKASEGVGKVKSSTKDAGSAAKELGAGMAVAGAAIAAGLGLAVKAFADFDKEMSNVRAVSGATAAEMQQLTDAALAAGAATKFSASDAATAEAELVKAGISVKDVLGGGLNGALSLAAAGNLDLANAATVSANAMNIFGLEGKDVSHIADVLAAGANKSAADVDQLAQAMQQSGLVASQMGLSLEETVGILSAFADNGLKGSDAGTSLKTMLQRLVPSSAAAATAMKDIGFSAFDAQGNMKSLDVIAGDLQQGLSGLTEEQKAATINTIFGADAVRAANVAFKLGTQGVNEYTTAVNDQGAAARVAAIQMDNLAGDMENLRGSIETALIKGGSGANDALRGLAQAATDAVNAFGELPDEVQTGVVQLAALASGALLLGGGLLSVIPKIKATKEAIDALTTASPKAAGALGALGKAGLVVGIAAAGEEIKNLASAARVGEPPVQDLARGLTELGDGFKNSADFAEIFNRGMGPFEKRFDNLSDALTDFGDNARLALNPSTFEKFFQGADQASSVFDKRIGQIDKALVQMVRSGNADQAAKAVQRLEKAAQDAGLAAGRVTAELPEYTAAAENAAVANGKFAASTDDLAYSQKGAQGKGDLLSDEIQRQKDAAEDAKKAYEDLTTAVQNYGSELDDALGATSAYEAAVDKAEDRVAKRAEIQAKIAKLTKADAKGNAEEIARLREELTKYAATLDQGTEAGRDNIDVLRELAKTAKSDAVASFTDGLSFGEVADQMDKAREKFIKLAQALGASPEKAKFLADNLGLTRENLEKLQQAPDVKKKVTVDTSQVDAALNGTIGKIQQTDGLIDQVDGRVVNATVNAETGGAISGLQTTDGLLDVIDGKLVAPTLQVDPKPAADAIGDISYLLDATSQKVATPSVDADMGTSLTDISTFDQLMSQLDGKTATATVQVAYERVGPSLEAIAGLADGTLGFKGFDTGGYTGDFDPRKVAGFVHGREFVFTEQETARAGVGNLQALARSLRGYADGGYVPPRFADRGMISSAATTNNYGGNVTNDRRISIDKVVATDFASFEREADRRRRLDSLGTRRAH